MEGVNPREMVVEDLQECDFMPSIRGFEQNKARMQRVVFKSLLKGTKKEEVEIVFNTSTGLKSVNAVMASKTVNNIFLENDYRIPIPSIVKINF